MTLICRECGANYETKDFSNDDGFCSDSCMRTNDEAYEEPEDYVMYDEDE